MPNTFLENDLKKTTEYYLKFNFLFESTILLAHFRRKMAQLCLCTKVHTKQRLVLGASDFQCTSMSVGFLCPKCHNVACLHTRQDQNELDLKSDFFFLPKSLCRNISQRCSGVYTTIFVLRKDKTNYLSN